MPGSSKNAPGIALCVCEYQLIVICLRKWISSKYLYIRSIRSSLSATCDFSVHLSRQLAPGGRLTIAHGMSRAAINRHHSGSASKVSVGLIPETELAEILNEWFTVDVVVSNDEIYVVSGMRAESSAVK